MASGIRIVHTIRCGEHSSYSIAEPWADPPTTDPHHCIPIVVDLLGWREDVATTHPHIAHAWPTMRDLVAQTRAELDAGHYAAWPEPIEAAAYAVSGRPSVAAAVAAEIRRQEAS